MIDRITGEVLTAGATFVVVQVGGLGLRALCPPATAARMPPGTTATLFTTLVPREDSLTLFGFCAEDEREAFELVQTASGVGPKLALAIVSVLAPGDLATVVATGDVKRLTSVPGIGVKGAQKIIIELKDKMAGFMTGGSATQTSQMGAQTGDWREQVITGLQGLGWSSAQAEAACDKVSHLAQTDSSPTPAVLMRAALQTLAR